MENLSDKWTDRLWTVGLLIAALLLFTIDLGNLPLRDWDEGIVAKVAREISRTPGQFNWLYPTLDGTPYFNKPPLIHWLIALNYQVFGVNEWSSRLPGAILTAISVPFLYSIGREIFVRRTGAIFAALVYLTFLPVVRNGRLAMLDGAVICFFLLSVWCLLRSRRNLRYTFGIGIGLGCICLTKGIVGILLAAILVLFIAWDTPRLLTSWYLYTGLLLGIMPMLSWYISQWLHYGQTFIGGHVFNQSLQRIWDTVEGNTGPPWYYLLEILKYSWPWLLFLPQAFIFAWENRNLGWSKLVIVWSAGYFFIISAMSTKLPWYILPVYPALALAIGPYLAEIWHSRFSFYLSDILVNSHHIKILELENIANNVEDLENQGNFNINNDNFISINPYCRAWLIILGILAVGGWCASIYFGFFAPLSERDLLITLVAAALTFTITAFLIYQRDRLFLSILCWGCYVTLLLFVNSNHWVWELAEAYPVKPVAAIIKNTTPEKTIVYTSYSYTRPSLDFYSDRQVVPLNSLELQQTWQKLSQPYFLIDNSSLPKLNLPQIKPLASAKGWSLITKE